ncbi:hypothetical protein [Janibacter melonis]|uniref:hypothetical protein n=1 Tax=Janibacter melonis TaxID=262209 RepID=UPI00174E8322|nr:hypothetical protein [Janibacter melonis]
MNRLPAFVASAAAVVALGVVVAPAATAACEAPSITVSPTKAKPGDQVTITGAAFGTDCNDTGNGDEDTTPEPVLGDPAADIDLVLSADGTRSTLATVDADADYAFVQRVTLPAHVTGPVEIYATLAEGYDTDPVTLTIQEGQPPASTPSASTEVARPAVVQTDSPPKSQDNGPVLLLGGAGAIALIAAGLGIGRSRKQGASRPAH